MEYLIHHFGYLQALLAIIAFVFIRYLIFAGIPYLYFYQLKRKKLVHQKIQQTFPTELKIRNEIKHSFVTALIFSLFGLVIYFLRINGLTQIYTTITDYSYGYFFMSILLFLLIHDTYFYWMHRVVHHPKLFPFIHKLHHDSRNPTPFASFSFHVAEAFVEILIFPILILFIPIHPLALFTVFTISILFNIMGHLGYEFLPIWFVKHPVLKWVNTSTHHNMHHQKASANFGLYLNFWDTLMHTNHKNYIQKFTEITTKIKKANIAKVDKNVGGFVN